MKMLTLNNLIQEAALLSYYKHNFCDSRTYVQITTVVISRRMGTEKYKGLESAIENVLEEKK